MREVFEQKEMALLSPLAVKSCFSRGRRFEEPLASNRTAFQRDRDRIVHSKAFRRLKDKTQVFVATESDHFRSRLTHTIEVSQISRHLSRLLSLNEDLSESIALAHDLGHTPFGHAGETTLNELMRTHGGFEHNRQSLRVVDFLEHKYPSFDGLNLTYEVREGLIKHNTPYDKGQGDGLVTLESQVVNLADEIAYNNHDIDDGIGAGILLEADLEKDVVLWREAKKKVQEAYTNLTEKQLRYRINSYLISSQIDDVLQASQEKILRLGLSTFDELQSVTDDVISYSQETKEKAAELRAYLMKAFYTHPDVYRMNKKGQNMIKGLFKAFSGDQNLLPKHYSHRVSEAYPLEKVIADYIAGMTDNFAKKEYHSLYM